MELHARDMKLDLSYPHVMGILNVTPDSFSDGGIHNNLAKAIVHTNAMVNAGAAIIDVGGESTRPGADLVSTAEELDRVIPVIEASAQRFEVWISVDTSRAEVIRESTAAGVHMINDIRALRSTAVLEAANQSGLPICLMHMQGEPGTMQNAPTYENVVHSVMAFFTQQIERCTVAGISRDRLILDPGFGFGKDLVHNYQLLAQLAEFHQFGLPLMVGLSRKSMIGKILNAGPTQRLSGSLACAVIAAMQGAHIIRVHDVRETVEAMRIVEATCSAKG